MTIKNYIQRYVLLKIDSGDWKKNEKLPSENQLSIKFNCSRITARQALMPLVNSGFLKVIKGKGYIVSDDTGDSNLQSFIERYTVTKTKVNPSITEIKSIREALDMEEEDRFFMFDKKYYDEKGLLSYQITYLNNERIWDKNVDGFEESITKELALQGAPITKSSIEIRHSSLKGMEDISLELGYKNEYPIEIVKSYSADFWIERTVRITRSDKFKIYYTKTKF